MIGRIGPKISSDITGSSAGGSTITVGSIRSAARSDLPPVTTVPPVALISDASRSNCRSLTMRSDGSFSSARNCAIVATILSASSAAIVRSAST